MSKVILLGSTGLTGNVILSELVANPKVELITTLSRNPPKVVSPKITAVTLPTDQWFTESNLPLFKDHDVAISAFGTTKVAAGGDIVKWKQIDYGVNADFAKTCHDQGVSKFILISSIGASSKSMFAYMKSKGELEEYIGQLGFKDYFILRPGLLTGGKRENLATQAPSDKLLRDIGAYWPLSTILQANSIYGIAQFVNGLLETTGIKSYTSGNIRSKSY